MHLFIIQFQRQFSIERLHNDTRINASNVSSFNRLMWSMFTQSCLENPRSHIVVLAKAEVAVIAELKLEFRSVS